MRQQIAPAIVIVKFSLSVKMIIGGTLEQRWGRSRVETSLARVAARLARMADSQI